MGVDQAANTIDVSEPPLRHTQLPPPPHNGIGREEDSLLNVLMVRPKPPRQDLVRLMTLSGEILRFECKMVTGQPEDDVRKLIVGYFPADYMVAVWEIPVRNSGIVGGKFAEKTRIKNPDTGAYFEMADFAVGKMVKIKAHPLLITRADEHTLQYTEAHPDEYPYADPIRCAQKFATMASMPEFSDPEGIDPDKLKSMARSAGIEIIDHEIITLLRFFGVDELEGVPRISGPKLLASM